MPGSSPRLRGAQIRVGAKLLQLRLIPASAGSTSSDPRPGCVGWAHPRVCGEHGYLVHGRASTTGSSPRLRGAPIHLAASIGEPRLIPASAGSTRRRSPDAARSGAHPRVCGEHRRGKTPTVHARGSSPRLRGARSCHRRDTPSCRLIPASAGSTPNQDGTSIYYPAHPRVCGEHGLRGGPVGVELGSSPRLRGAPVASVA